MKNTVKIFILLIICLACWLLFSSSSLAITVSFDGSFLPEAYDINEHLYCISQGTTISPPSDILSGISNRYYINQTGWSVTYTSGSATYINNSSSIKNIIAAYKVARGDSCSSIQNVIWGYGGTDEENRFARYITSAGNVGGENNKELVKDLTDYSKVQTYISSNGDGTGYYLMGPYKLSMPKESRNSVIKDNNKGYFQIKKLVVKDQNGSAIPENQVTVLDSAGNQMSKNMPEEKKDFYIKINITDKTRAEKIESLYPEFTFNYINYLTGTFYNCTGSGTVYYTYKTREKKAYACDHYDSHGNPTHNYACNGTYYKYYGPYNGTKSYTPQKCEFVYGSYSRTEKTVKLKAKTVTMELGGVVWQDGQQGKESRINGIRDDSEKYIPGVEVTLYDKDNKVVTNTIGKVQKTVTDGNGKYSFKNLNPFKKYYVKFKYNGQIYQHTYYNKILDGTHSLVTETYKARDELNNRFKTISDSPNNYATNSVYPETYTNYKAVYKQLQAKVQEIAKQKNDEVTQDKDGKVKKTQADFDIYQLAYEALMKNASNETKKILQYIEDCRIVATTGEHSGETQNVESKSNDLYPTYSKFYINDYKSSSYTDNKTGVDVCKTTFNILYKKKNEQRNINLGLNEREKFDLSLIKDLYQATLKINGKTKVYKYNDREVDGEKFNLVDNPEYGIVASSPSRQSSNWDVESRKESSYSTPYIRKLRKSDYLYCEELSYSEEDRADKDLKVYLTYKIAVRNQSQSIEAKVNEIVDYYDKSQFKLDGVYQGTEEGPSNTTITNSDQTNTELGNEYDGKVVIGSKNGIQNEDGSVLLEPGEKLFVYVTFEVNKTTDNTNGLTNRIKVDQNLEIGTETKGKQNIAEINEYETYYSRKPSRIPQKGNSSITKDNSVVAGLVDIDSNPGNLSSADLDSDGNLIKEKIEDDTDKAPNIKLIIDNNENNRVIEGNVWEDLRVASGNISIGDGKKDNKPIDGVTVQLIELIPNGSGGYKKEYIWSENVIENGNKQSNETYYTGQSGNLKPIISGNGFCNVPTYTVEAGQYKFTSIPAGDFIVRFKYGDTERTVLTNDYNNEVNKVLEIRSETDQDSRGLNDKSYNGQDFKSTTYQKETTNYSYNGIGKYSVSNNQNGSYTYDKNSNEVSLDTISKKNLYIYDINGPKDYSDAKDLKAYRDRAIAYSDSKLTNHKAEVLNSPYQVPQYPKMENGKKVVIEGKVQYEKYSKDNMQDLINELIGNTAMVADSGVINTQIELDPISKSRDNKQYVIGGLDLGLEERPKAQLTLNKEVSNFKITLANDMELFNANQQVKDLTWNEHEDNTVDIRNNRLEGVKFNNMYKTNGNDSPLLVKTEIDDEIMHGATFQVTYLLKVKNVSEVDYFDEGFYNKGIVPIVPDANKIVTTKADTIVDYVTNQIQYKPDNNKYQSESGSQLKDRWTIVDSSIASDEKFVNNNLVNHKYEDTLKTYNMILKTKEDSEEINKALIPEIENDENCTAETKLVLSVALTPEDGTNSMVYNNLAEIVSTTNKVGRRMAYSVAGNQEMADQTQDPNGEYLSITVPKEIDADSAQTAKILTPTGQRQITQIIIILALAGIIISGGIIFIKKKVI